MAMNQKKSEDQQRSATDARRVKIVNLLSETKMPVSATSLAATFGVSRQIIVGDVALLRASGLNISATPRGYLYTEQHDLQKFDYEGIVACNHLFDRLKEELYAIVDLGGTLIDVTIEHSLYGQLSGLLDISSRYDADLFVEKIKSGQGDLPLSNLTGGIHLHKIGCRDEKTFDLIKTSLKEKGLSLL